MLSKKNLNKNIEINFNSNRSIINIKGLYGIFIYKMPSYYFYKLYNNTIKFIFINKFIYISFIKHFIMLYKKLSFLYSVRLRVKGLGYRIRKITNNLYYFFFNYNNMYYFYLPKNILLKWYKKRLLLISNNLFLIKLLFSHMLLLKNIGPYRLRGLRYPRQIIFIKKGGKKL
jgi:hypothetical protein